MKLFDFFKLLAIKRAFNVLSKHIGGPLAWFIIEWLIEFIADNIDRFEELAEKTPTKKDDKVVEILRKIVQIFREAGIIDDED